MRRIALAGAPRKSNVRLFLLVAALPLVTLALLTVVGGRADVGVLMTGSGAHALLGAGWVAAWLASVVVSPIAAAAALVALALTRLARLHSGPI